MHIQKSTFKFILSQRDLNLNFLIYSLSVLSLYHIVDVFILFSYQV